MDTSDVTVENKVIRGPSYFRDLEADDTGTINPYPFHCLHPYKSNAETLQAILPASSDGRQ
jgi:hypothetical protein